MSSVVRRPAALSVGHDQSSVDCEQPLYISRVQRDPRSWFSFFRSRDKLTRSTDRKGTASILSHPLVGWSIAYLIHLRLCVQ